MSVAAGSGLTLAARIGEDHDPTRDRRYQQARSARAVADWLARLDVANKAPRTRDQYERDVSRLLLMFPSKHVEEFTDGDILQALATFPPTGRPKRASAYASFFKFLLLSGRIEKNPMDLIPEMKADPQKHIETFTDAEVAALCGLGGIDGTLMMLLFETGIRKGEARQLRLRDTQIDRGRVVVLKGKGRKTRVIPMIPALQGELAERSLLEGLNPDDHWWYRVHANAVSRTVKRDHPVGEGTFHRWWADCVDRAGVRYLKPHTTRHTFATLWFKRGLSPKAIQQLLGHSSIQITMDLYVHTSIDDAAAEMLSILERL